MTDRPENFAEQPDDADPLAPDEELDALSEILHTVRLRGDRLVRCAPAPPFAIAIPAGIRLLHIAERGDLVVHVDGRTVALRAGDMVLLARGERHVIGAGDAPERVLTAADTVRRLDPLPDPATPRWVTGTFRVEEVIADPLLSVLPAAVVVRAGAGRDWLTLSSQLLVAELTDARPGAGVMISRILDLLFIHALRAWSAEDDTAPGWLTAALDPALGPVLTAIHNEPDRPWPITELAALARLSRSAFTDRFTRLLGRSPGAYVTDRRLEHAAHLLGSTDEPVGRIAGAVGYHSEAAFNRAFHRRYGMPPLRWRKRADRVRTPSPRPRC
ncbi:AraC family transcriptional regulator [Nocardia asteroides]|uniref:AraC family transcriptional regulator n=1 Tax=Nocardia asteroides TaxID=1824 RepID=UPI001E60ECA1|nr:AraC family transcriptional regulator [Nocardia asteroides]UGT57128.1 AraC family transcriptional regulator [Nocardia asteroides]